MRLIDADALYEAMQDAEELARRRVLDTESTVPYPNNLNPAYTRYLAQMDERTKAKEMVADAPTVDAVKVVMCKDCKWFNKIGCAIRIQDESDKPHEDDFCSFAERRTDGSD